jgi:hypothetical protein
MDKRFCTVCGDEINPLRVKALPETKTCINHSTVGAKRGRILTLGEGDHTYNEIEILDEETYRKVVAIELGVDRLAEEMPEIQNYDQTLVADDTRALKEKAEKFLDDEEDVKLLEDPDEVIEDSEEEEEEE